MVTSATVPSEAPLAAHLLPESATVDAQGRLSIGGCDVLELVERFGTPVFIYDEAELRARCAEAVQSFDEGVAYATKAFLTMAMARLAYESGLCLDVSTAGELEIALLAGVPGTSLILHGNNKSDAEIARAIDLGVRRIVVDSFDEIARLSARSETREAPQQLMVRVTPGVEAHTHEYVMTGQEDSKFGFTLDSGLAQQAIARLRELKGFRVAGLHAHIGSQIFRLDAFERAIEKLVPLLERYELDELCIGGGLGVAYLNDESAPSIGEWAKTVRDACARAGVADHVRITAEPGRAIVARAAITCYRVGGMKEIAGTRTYLAVDGGMSDNPRPVLYGSGYEAFLPRETGAARKSAFRVVGKHCESGDILIADARLPHDVRVGDVLATPVTGAYGYSMASNYNRLGRPPVVFVRDGEARVVARREEVDDLIRLEV
jgi:diaminopimelate decarboxylase